MQPIETIQSMLDLEYQDFVIKIKAYGQNMEWLAVIRDKENKTVASQWLETQSQAQEWAVALINKMLNT